MKTKRLTVYNFVQHPCRPFAAFVQTKKPVFIIWCSSCNIFMCVVYSVVLLFYGMCNSYSLSRSSAEEKIQQIMHTYAQQCLAGCTRSAQVCNSRFHPQQP